MQKIILGKFVAEFCKKSSTIQKSRTRPPLNQKVEMGEQVQENGFLQCDIYSLINAMLLWMGQMSGLNAESPPTINVLQLEYDINSVEEGSYSGQPSFMIVV